jgi:hypothetical protein
MKVPHYNVNASAIADLASADALRVDFPDGRHGWPTIVQYRWAIESAAPDGATTLEEIVSSCPPRLAVDTEVDPKFAPGQTERRTYAYKVDIQPGECALYDALAMAGRLRDPRHIGAASGGDEAQAA